MFPTNDPCISAVPYRLIGRAKVLTVLFEALQTLQESERRGGIRCDFGLEGDEAFWDGLTHMMEETIADVQAWQRAEQTQREAAPLTHGAAK